MSSKSKSKAGNAVFSSGIDDFEVEYPNCLFDSIIGRLNDNEIKVSHSYDIDQRKIEASDDCYNASSRNFWNY